MLGCRACGPLPELVVGPHGVMSDELPHRWVGTPVAVAVVDDGGLRIHQGEIALEHMVLPDGRHALAVVVRAAAQPG